MNTSIALTIAGSDSGGGAGIQADLKAFSALGVYGASVITAVTAQNTRTVTAVHEVPAQIVADQISAVTSDLNVGAIKIGMLFSPSIIAAVADTLAPDGPPVVLDPVMIAKSGDSLLQAEAVDALKRLMLPKATLLTPNLPEAAALTGQGEATTQAQALDQARRLLDLGPAAVLIKGGHASGEICEDLLVDASGHHSFAAPRIATRNTHGTGCTFSAAIAAQLALGQPLHDAVEIAHNYLHSAIKHANLLSVGQGHGPVHHFHAMWDTA